MRLARFRYSQASLGAIFGVLTLVLSQAPSSVSAAASAHSSLSCAAGRVNCTEVEDSETVFGEGVYVGHDEPSVLFYSNQPGSGNRDRWLLTLPKDPPAQPKQDGSGGTWNFQLHPAFWFGMAMCDTQSAPHPLALHTCAPDSDSNITTDANIANHNGTAFMEMQFYPPGWAPWPAGNSCDATKWCAAFNIDSLSMDYPSGQPLNSACRAVTGIEPVNFAFITRNGIPQGPPNPVESTLATFTPDPAVDLMMNSGDKILVTMHDTPHGLRIDLKDLTNHQQGFMVSSAANGFGQVKFAPSPSTECTNIPYDFHPMYSTSSEHTRVPWAAHSYNIAFSDEIGHFDFCQTTAGGGSDCSTTGTEGVDGETSEGGSPNVANDDSNCFAAGDSTLVPVSGCIASNAGFDGTPYQRVWPDGNTAQHPTPIMFTSPRTGEEFESNYTRAAFEVDLPRIESADSATAGACQRLTDGSGCTRIPLTDDQDTNGNFIPAAFYPFYTAAQSEENCQWTLGNDIPGITTNDFGKNNQYGPILPLLYPKSGGGGATTQRFNNFRGILDSNPCLAGEGGQ